MTTISARSQTASSQLKRCKIKIKSGLHDGIRPTPPHNPHSNHKLLFRRREERKERRGHAADDADQTSVQHERRPTDRGRQWPRGGGDDEDGRRNGRKNAATVTGQAATGRPRPPPSHSLTLDSLPPSHQCRRRRDAQTIRGEEEEVSHIIPLQREERREERERAAVSQPQCPRKSKAAAATDGRTDCGLLAGERQKRPSPRAPSRPIGRPRRFARPKGGRDRGRGRRFICIDSKGDP